MPSTPLQAKAILMATSMATGALVGYAGQKEHRLRGASMGLMTGTLLGGNFIHGGAGVEASLAAMTSKRQMMGAIVSQAWKAGGRNKGRMIGAAAGAIAAPIAGMGMGSGAMAGYLLGTKPPNIKQAFKEMGKIKTQSNGLLSKFIEAEKVVEAHGEMEAWNAAMGVFKDLWKSPEAGSARGWMYKKAGKVVGWKGSSKGVTSWSEKASETLRNKLAPVEAKIDKWLPTVEYKAGAPYDAEFYSMPTGYGKKFVDSTVGLFNRVTGNLAKAM